MVFKTCQQTPKLLFFATFHNWTFYKRAILYSLKFLVICLWKSLRNEVKFFKHSFCEICAIKNGDDPLFVTFTSIKLKKNPKRMITFQGLRNLATEINLGKWQWTTNVGRSTTLSNLMGKLASLKLSGSWIFLLFVAHLIRRTAGSKRWSRGCAALLSLQDTLANSKDLVIFFHNVL